MKKSILVLSALLTLVVSGICLQSCSSEYDEYTTEEYGYYTEEENALVRALAEKYGLYVEINEEYYGHKCSMAKIEEEMQALASLIGKQEIKLAKRESDKFIYTICKESISPARSATRAIEGQGKWSGSEISGDYTISVEIKWSGNGTLEKQTASGTASISRTNNNSSTSDDYSAGGLTCSINGNNGIDFSGWVSYSQCTETNYVEQKKYYTKYHFSINAGQVSTTTPASGSFMLTGGSPQNFTEDL